MGENKQEICDALCATLQRTWAGRGLEKIAYENHGGAEECILIFEDRKVSIRVNLDSGVMMMKDIIEAFA